MNKIPVFDIGDTLLPSHKKINEAIREELKKQGIEDPAEFPINEYNIYVPEEVDQWLTEHGINANAEKIKKAYINWEKEFLRENVIPQLKKLNKDFGPIGFISDNSIPAKNFYQNLFQEQGLEYRGFIVSEEVGVEKPNPQIFEKFLEERDETPERFVYFGNYVDRDQAAERVDMNFIWVKAFNTFGSNTEGLQIDKINYENVEKALKQISKIETVK